MENKLSINSSSLEETDTIAKLLSEQLLPGMVIALNGDLGAGKTTFIKALVRYLGSPEIVTSPTFTILNIYSGKLPVYHFDFYRLETVDDIENIGGSEMIPSSKGITLIEWAEKIKEVLPEKLLTININYRNEYAREFNFISTDPSISLERIDQQWRF